MHSGYPCQLWPPLSVFRNLGTPKATLTLPLEQLDCYPSARIWPPCPPPAVLRRPWEPMEALACCTGLGLAAQDSFLPRLVSSTISRLPPPLSCAFKLRVLEAFALESRCKFHGLALAPASHLISPGSPAQQPLQPGYSPTLSLPHYIPGSFPPPHLCSSHCLGLEHPFHLSTY